jgi:hypothetical protein
VGPGQGNGILCPIARSVQESNGSRILQELHLSAKVGVFFALCLPQRRRATCGA